MFGYLFHGEAALGEAGHQVVGGCKGESQFLDDAGACIVDVAAVDSQHAEARQVLLGKADKFDGFVEGLFFTVAVAAVQQCVAKDVVVEAALHLGGVVAVLLHHLKEVFEGLQRVLATGEVDFACFGMDAFQQGLHLFETVHLAGAQAYGVGTAFQGFQGKRVGLFEGFGLDVLTDVPHVVVGVFATGIGRLVGIAVEVFQVFQILSAVVGLYLKAFDGLPHQFLFIVGTFEVLIYHFFPFFGGHWRKFAKQFVVFHYIMSFYYQQLSKQSYDYFSK